MPFHKIKTHQKGYLPFRAEATKTPRKQEIKKGTIRRHRFVVCCRVAAFDGIVVVVGVII